MAGKNYTVSAEFKTKVTSAVQGFNQMLQMTQRFRQGLNTTMTSSRSSVNNLANSLNHVDFDNINHEINDIGDGFETNTDRAGSSVNGFKSKIAGLAGMIAGAFAVDKIKDFAVSMVEASAEAQAITAQFEQVFGDVQKEAQETVNGLGKEFGMAPNRIKPSLTQMTSMFKGLGMDTKDAMTTAKDAVTLTADAAAFYDKSFEDANSALNSFIKGNYEGGESIGLFANETQLASWAADNLGLEWQSLDEKGKQVARLEFAEAMQKAAGATGQASRESNSYQNQLGNLRQRWTDLKAKLGEPILTPVINGLKTVADWIAKVDTDKIIKGFQSVGTYLKDTLKPTLDDVKNGLQFLWDKFKETGGLQTAKDILEGFKDALLWIRDHAEVVTAGLAGIVGAITTFKIISGINTAIGIFNTLMTAMRTGTLLATLAQWGLNTALLANPFTWIAVGIGALIAIIILLWKNWDSVSKWLGESWDWIKSKASSVFTGIGNYIASLKDKAVSKFTELKDGTLEKISSLLSSTKTKFEELKNKIVNPINDAKEKVVAKFNELKKGSINKVSELKNSAIDKFNQFKTAVVTIVSRLASQVVNFFKSIYTGARSNFNNVISSAKSIFGTLKNAVLHPVRTAKDLILKTFKSISLSSVGKDIIRGLVNGITSMAGDIKQKVKDIASLIPDGIKKFLGIHSPSRVMMGLGKFVSQGLAQGMDDDSSLVSKATEGLSNIVQSINTTLTPTYTPSMASLNGSIGNVNNTSASSSVASYNRPININLNIDNVNNKNDADDLVNYMINSIKNAGGRI